MGRQRARKKAQQTAVRHAIAEPPLRAVRVDRRTLAGAAIVSLIVFAVFAATAARDLVVGDTAEFVTVAVTFGVAHPSGYPLLTILGHMFSWLPVGPLPFRVDLLSVASGAAAAGFIFLIASQLGAGAIASAIAAFTLAFHPLFWEWSLVIEAFPLNNLMVTIVWYFLLRWEGEPASQRHLVIAAFATGLAGSNHQTVVFLIPAILIVLWRRRARVLRDPRLVVTCVAAAALGFVPYLTIPWAASRQPFISWGSISSFDDLLGHFLRKAYGTGNLAAPGEPPGTVSSRLMLLLRSFTILQWLLIPAGALEIFKRQRWYFWATVTVFLVAGPLFASIANLNVTTIGSQWVLQRFFLLPHVILAPLVAFGVMLLTDLASRLAFVPDRRFAYAAISCVAAGAIGFGAVTTYPRVDQRTNHLARNYGEDILSSLPPRAILLSSGDDVVLPVAYLQAIEHRRPDVTLVMLGILKGGAGAWYIPQLRRRDPTLVVPFDLYDRRRPTANIKALVDANPSRRFALVGDPLDDSLKDTHWYYRRGLVEDIVPLATDVTLDVASAENDRLMRSYHIPDPKTVKYTTFESGILGRYALAAKKIGDEYATAQMNAEAAVWYRRALEMFPGLIDAQDALKRVTR